MSEYKRRQDECFKDLKDILEEKGMSKTIQSYLARIEDVFRFYIVADLDWEMIHLKSISLDGKKLENFLKGITETIESYME